MSNEEKIQLQHPEGKHMPRIEMLKYELIHNQIISILGSTDSIKPMMLLRQVAEDLKEKIEGSIAWYAESVKLDMEAKGELIHDRKKGLIKAKHEV